MLELTQSLATFNRSLCNSYSNLFCAAFLSTVPGGFARQAIQANLATIPAANALYQGNDDCVKADLTSMYWGSSFMTTISTFVVAVIGLFTI